MRTLPIVCFACLCALLASCDNRSPYDYRALGFSSQSEMEVAFGKGYHTKKKLDEMTHVANAALAPTPAGSPPTVVPETVQKPAAPEASDLAAANQSAAPTQIQAIAAPDNGPFAPSFDCTNASTGQERLICSDRDLAKMDVDLHQAYVRARELSADKQSLLARQREWIKHSLNSCSDKNCLLLAYTSRIRELTR